MKKQGGSSGPLDLAQTARRQAHWCVCNRVYSMCVTLTEQDTQTLVQFLPRAASCLCSQDGHSTKFSLLGAVWGWGSAGGGYKPRWPRPLQGPVTHPLMCLHPVVTLKAVPRFNLNSELSPKFVMPKCSKTRRPGKTQTPPPPKERQAGPCLPSNGGWVVTSLESSAHST